MIVTKYPHSLFIRQVLSDLFVPPGRIGQVALVIDPYRWDNPFFGNMRALATNSQIFFTCTSSL